MKQLKIAYISVGNEASTFPFSMYQHRSFDQAAFQKLLSSWSPYSGKLWL
jgi:hypothetical protein